MTNLWDHVVPHNRDIKNTLPAVDFVLPDAEVKTTVFWAPVYKNVIFKGVAVGTLRAKRDDALTSLATKYLRLELADDLSVVSAVLVNV